MPCLNWRSQETLYTDVEIAAYAICVRTVMLSLHPEKFYVSITREHIDSYFKMSWADLRQPDHKGTKFYGI